jgi:hypothetical protein
MNREDFLPLWSYCTFVGISIMGMRGRIVGFGRLTTRDGTSSYYDVEIVPDIHNISQHSARWSAEDVLEHQSLARSKENKSDYIEMFL